jgi:hypothetical protein
MRDVEKTDMLTGMKMFLHHPGRIGERHLPPSKRPEFRSGSFVNVFEG